MIFVKSAGKTAFVFLVFIVNYESSYFSNYLVSTHFVIGL